jgi:hypothetical protein
MAVRQRRQQRKNEMWRAAKRAYNDRVASALARLLELRERR